MTEKQEDWVLHSSLWERFRQVTLNGIPDKWPAPRTIHGAYLGYWEEVAPAILAMEQFVLSRAGDIDLSLEDFGELKPALELLRSLKERGQ
jgi:hypothetical protein